MGGECRSLEVLYLLLLGRALRKERKERKVQPEAAFLPAPRPQLCHHSSSQEESSAILKVNSAVVPRGALI